MFCDFLLILFSDGIFIPGHITLLQISFSDCILISWAYHLIDVFRLFMHTLGISPYYRYVFRLHIHTLGVVISFSDCLCIYWAYHLIILTVLIIHVVEWSKHFSRWFQYCGFWYRSDITLLFSRWSGPQFLSWVQYCCWKWLRWVPWTSIAYARSRVLRVLSWKIILLWQIYYSTWYEERHLIDYQVELQLFPLTHWTVQYFILLLSKRPSWALKSRIIFPRTPFWLSLK